MKNGKYTRELKIIAAQILLLIAITIGQRYVANYYDEGKGFEWDAYASTSVGMQMMFAKCDFQYTGYYSHRCERSVMLYGDSTDGKISCGGSGIGDDIAMYPNHLEVLYYDFNENKFYGGKYPLDYNKIFSVAEKMRKAVQLTDIGKTESIDFNIKVYPKGKIVLSMESYITTNIGEIVIASFEAKPEKHDWSVFEQRDESSVGGIGKSNSIEVQRALLLNKYDWQIQMVLPEQYGFKKLDLDIYGNRTLNIETIKSLKMPTFSQLYYLPKNINLDWQRKDTIRFFTVFHFEEKETIQAFEEISNKGQLPITMQLIVKDDTTSIRAVLLGNGKSIELKESNPSEIYSDKIYHNSE
jgi:hypothetical protein